MMRRRDFLERAGMLAGLGALPSAWGWAGELVQERSPVPFVDGLCFMPADLSDLPRSGLCAFILDVSQAQRIDTQDGSMRFYRSFEACSRSIVAMRRLLRKEQGRGVFLASRGSQIVEAFQTGKTAVFFQFQGCEPLGEDLSRLDLFYELGLRIQQITHHNNNPFGGGALEKDPIGLTKLGFEGVERMNELGIVPDISHASDPTSMDVIRTSSKPVILSHGGARALVRNARCAPDEVIRGVADSGGVTGIFMMSFWLTEDPQPKVEHWIRQVRHVIQMGGIDSVGIANDFPMAGQTELASIGNDNAEGVKGYLPWWNSIAKDGILGFDRLPQHVVIPQLNDIRRMFTIHRALQQAGFKAAEIEKVMGGNWIRVLTDTLG